MNHTPGQNDKATSWSVAALKLQFHLKCDLRGLFFSHIPFDRAGVGAGGAFLAGWSVGAGLRAVAHATLAGAASATQHADVGHAGVCARGAVTVLALPAGVALTEAAVAFPMI